MSHFPANAFQEIMWNVDALKWNVHSQNEFTVDILNVYSEKWLRQELL